MNEHQGGDARARALLAAASILGLALGVAPAKADPLASTWGSTDEKPGAQSNQLKVDQLKSNQHKANQLKSEQLKSNQLKSNQTKLRGMEGGEIPKGPGG
jgi:hypothetical protein